MTLDVVIPEVSSAKPRHCPRTRRNSPRSNKRGGKFYEIVCACVFSNCHHPPKVEKSLTLEDTKFRPKFEYPASEYRNSAPRRFETKFEKNNNNNNQKLSLSRPRLSPPPRQTAPITLSILYVSPPRPNKKPKTPEQNRRKTLTQTSEKTKTKKKKQTLKK